MTVMVAAIIMAMVGPNEKNGVQACIGRKVAITAMAY
jgi:hypothetical protein